MNNHSIIEENNANSEKDNDRLIQQQAIASLIQGVMLAQKKGAYSLEEASELNKAVKIFVSPQNVE